MIRSLAAAALVSASALVACDDAPALPPADTSAPDTSVQQDTATAEDTQTADSDGPDPSCTVEPTLSSLKANYFATSCSFSGCHGSRGASADLDLASDGLHARLIEVAADDGNARGRGKKLVVAGDPDASFLYQKVSGTHQRDEGFLMPDGADAPVDPGCRIFMLRKWIADGALDN
jgi:hypothetical protein